MREKIAPGRVLSTSITRGGLAGLAGWGCWTGLLTAGVLSIFPAALSGATEASLSAAPWAEAFSGQDLHLAGRSLVSYQESPEEQILVFEDGFSMTIGANQLASESAVVWLASIARQYRGRARIDYEATVYLCGNVSVKRGQTAKATPLTQMSVEGGESLVACFLVTGEVFATAERREVADPRQGGLYRRALEAAAGIKARRDEPIVRPEALVPAVPQVEKVPAEPVRQPGLQEAQAGQKKPLLQYPVNIAAAGAAAPRIEKTVLPDGSEIATVIGRFYLWQQLDDKGTLLELQADSAVIFFAGGQVKSGEEETGRAGLLATGAVQAVYLSGDIVMTEGPRTIRAGELYYDFHRREALVVGAEMRTFDVGRGIPIYVRAGKLRQVAQHRFTAEDIVLTTSEFYLPQVSLTAASIVITDNTAVQAEAERGAKGQYDAQIHNLKLNVGQTAWFCWPYMRSNLERPDIPVKSIHVSNDNTWGTALETRWYLWRLLGLREPEGVDSTLQVDFYSKRGVGTGADIEYSGEDRFGRLQGYIIRDTGEDRLGRIPSRRDLVPPQDWRGRLGFEHRELLPDDWQLTLETSYLSDEHFLESFYREEFNTSKEQETIVHLKHQHDNLAMAFLGKWRINDFLSQVEELPSAELHWTGQSLFDDLLTLYSDSLVSRFRNRPSEDGTSTVSQDFFTFASTRNELDMPLVLGNAKIVPYVAGTVALDDGPGFSRQLDSSPGTRQDEVWLGETGLRASTQFWKVYPDVRSELWDVDGLRHIIKPQITASIFSPSDSVIDQRDTVSLAVLQRWQTKRGPQDSRRTVDWMRLNTELTWVTDSGDSSAGPDRLIWNQPFIPLADRLSGQVPLQDRRASDLFGPRRNYFATDCIWRVSDTAAVLNDLNFDMQSGVVQQFDIGLARFRWPNLNYYIGSRYLRRVEVPGLEEKGSNAFTFAATYMLNERYTLVFAQQYDFDYGANLRSDMTLIRRYHRIYWAITYSADRSLDRQAIVFSIWPEGVPEMGMGPRRYFGLMGAGGYN